MPRRRARPFDRRQWRLGSGQIAQPTACAAWTIVPLREGLVSQRRLGRTTSDPRILGNGFVQVALMRSESRCQTQLTPLGRREDNRYFSAVTGEHVIVHEASWTRCLENRLAGLEMAQFIGHIEVWLSLDCHRQPPFGCSDVGLRWPWNTARSAQQRDFLSSGALLNQNRAVLLVGRPCMRAAGEWPS